MVMLAACSLGGCQGSAEEGPAARTSTSSEALIVDEAHNAGSAGFLWLPPMVPRPALLGDVVLDAEPTVEIERVDAAGNPVAHIATYTRSSGPQGERVRLKRAGRTADPDDDDGDTDPDGFFLVRWKTDQFPGVVVDGVYRVSVYVPGRPGEPRVLLGLADVDVVKNQKAFKKVDRDEFVPLVDGRVLRIKFRVDRPAVDQDGDGVLDWNEPAEPAPEPQPEPAPEPAPEPQPEPAPEPQPEVPEEPQPVPEEPQPEVPPDEPQPEPAPEPAPDEPQPEVPPEEP